MIEQITPETRMARGEPGRATGDDQVVYCTHCGERNAADSRFCVRCGRTLYVPSEAGSQDTGPSAAEPAPYPRPAVTAYKTCGCPMGTVCGHDRLAGFGPRFLAFLIDAILIGIVAGLLRDVHLWGAASCADAVYFIAFWSTTGQTLGMHALRLRVVRTDGQPLSWVTGLLRYVGYVLSIVALCLGLLWIIWDPNKQGWHDKIANTVVVHTN